MTPLPLADVRVLDLSRGGPAEACARILAQLGAMVGGWGLGVGGWGSGSIGPDPWPLAPDPKPLPGPYDMVVSDAQPLELHPRGLAPARVAISVTPFGLDGPYVDSPEAGGEGFRLDGPVASALSGAHAAVAGLGALRWSRYRRRTVAVEVSALEVLATCMGEEIVRATCRRPTLAPHEGVHRPVAVLPCADGYVGVAAPTPVDRAHLAAMTGIDAVQREDADLSWLLGPWLSRRTRLDVFREAQLWRLPMVPVLAPEEVLRDEQCTARRLWEPGSPGGRLAARSPFRFGEPPPSASAHWGEARPPGRPGALPLSGVRVLDVGMVWAGPHCGRLLAGLGAEVIKVEGPTRRDGPRPPADWSGCWGAFADLNGGKASLVLDLSTGPGRDVFLRLARASDVVVENFSPRVMPNFGLDYWALSAANPSLIMLSMPAFGAEGPWGSYIAYGAGLELATGLWSRGPDGRPHAAPVPYLDYLAGAYGAAGVVAALLARDTTGRGAHLEVAQRDVACQLLRVAGLKSKVQSAKSKVDFGPGTWDLGLTLDPWTLASDPHLAARGVFARPWGERQPAGQACRHYARPPWRLHGVPLRPLRLAPGFGSDSRRVLRRVGRLEPWEIEHLIEAGVVAGPRSRRSRSGP